MSIRVYQHLSTPEGELRVVLNPGSGEPFAVIFLDEYGGEYIAIDSPADADRLIRAADRAKAMLAAPPQDGGAS